MTSKFYDRVLFAALASLPMLSGAAGNAWAADANTTAAPAPPEEMGNIVVTARKRSESILSVPVAISAMSREDLAKLNVKTIEDLVQVSPGVVINNATTGAARSDRSKSAVIIRAMAPTVGNQTTSIFVNGVPIGDGAVTGIFDLDRSEILKGPQSAYFGRQTFAGAVNLITAQPTNDWHGTFSAIVASGSYEDVNGAIGGPLIKDILSFRASGRYYTRDGTWQNEAEPGHTLGDQSTRSGSLMLKFTPSSALTVKLFAAGANDDDGPGATAVLEPDQSNCTLATGTHYFCGTLPSVEAGQPSARTAMTAGVQSLVDNYTSLLPRDEESDHFGLKRETRHYHGSIDYELPGGQTISSLTGWNRNDWSALYELNGRASPYPAVNTGYPYLPYTDWPLIIDHAQRDFSQELRIASKQNQAFRWLAGVSYLYQTTHERYGELYYFSGLDAGESGISESKTKGAFLGLNYDFLKNFTLDAEARYQADELIARDGVTGAIGYQKTYHSFMPRVSLQFKPSADTMLYATYSKGVNPGLGRDPLLSVPASERPALQAQGVTDGVLPEKLINYELGFKGKLFGGKLVIAGDVYHDIWQNKITEQTLIIPVTDSTPLEVNVYTNLGQVTLNGVELELTAAPVNGIVAHLAGALNDSHIDYGSCAICLTQVGSDNADGHQLGSTSKYSAEGWIEYAQPIGWKDFDAYFRPDFTYKSGMYESDGDYAKSSPQFVVDFRAGIRSGNATVEGFVTNAFNNKGYTSVLPDWQLDNPSESFGKYDTVYVGLPYLRTYGVKATFRF